MFALDLSDNSGGGEGGAGTTGVASATVVHAYKLWVFVDQLLCVTVVFHSYNNTSIMLSVPLPLPDLLS